MDAELPAGYLRACLKIHSRYLQAHLARYLRQIRSHSLLCLPHLAQISHSIPFGY